MKRLSQDVGPWILKLSLMDSRSVTKPQTLTIARGFDSDGAGLKMTWDGSRMGLTMTHYDAHWLWMLWCQEGREAFGSDVDETDRSL